MHKAARQLTQRPSGFPPYCPSALAHSPIHPVFPSPLPSPLHTPLPMNSHHGRRRSKPFAFIEFTDIDEAHDAKDQMDRREFQGRVIEVVFAQQKRKSPGEMRNRDGPPPRR